VPGYLLSGAATIQCVHAGQATPATPNPRVKVDGQPVVGQTSMFTVADCAQPPSIGPPCVTAQAVTAAARVKADGVPLLLQDSQAVCTPTGTLLTVAATQTRVKGM